MDAWLRRLYSNTENKVVDLDALQHTLRQACKQSFHGLFQHTPNVAEQAELLTQTSAQLQPLVLPELKIQQVAFKKSEYRATSATFKDNLGVVAKPQEKDDKLRKSCQSSEHASQVACETIVQSLTLTHDGKVHDLTPITMCWAAGFVFHSHSRSSRCKPTVLLDRERLSLHLVLTVLSNRLDIMFWQRLADDLSCDNPLSQRWFDVIR